MNGRMPERGPIELTVIVPCFNEEGNIPELSARVLKVFEVGELVGELVLVDDGSSDGTRDAIAEQEARHPDMVRGVIHGTNRGIAEAWKSGAEAARGRLCAIIDADLQYQPEDLLRMRRALYERSVDIVQGWRSAVGREKGPRWYYSRGFNWLLNATFSMDLSDNKSGFLICAREVLLDLLEYRGSYRYWQAFIMVAAKAKGYSYHEIETLFMSRMAGTSFLEHQAIKVSLLCFVDLTKAAWEYRLARRPPDVAQRFVETSAGGAESTGGPPTGELVKAYVASASSLPPGGRSGDVGHYLSAMQRTAEADADALKALQDEKLRRLIRHAYRDVPYYRHRMRQRKLRPEDVRGLDDLSKLPRLERASLREHLYFDILSEHHDKRQIFEQRASGWQGEPLGVFVDRVQLERRAAAALRARGWAGHRFGRPRLLLWNEALGRARDKADAWLADVHRHPIDVVDAAAVNDLVARASRLRPAVIEGPSETLVALARFMLRHGPCITGCVDALLVSGHSLSDDGRGAIRRAFGGEVYDAYGTAELGEIAHECRAHDGLHLASERVIVELLDPQGDPVRVGQRGEIVVTDLDNKCLPLIRYRTGDYARALDGACGCGLALPRIAQIEGRHPVAIGHHGRWLVGGFFGRWFADRGHAVARYRVSQAPSQSAEPGALVIDIVKAGRFHEELVTELRDAIGARLGDDVAIEVRLFDDDASWDEAPSVRPGVAR